MTEDIIEIDRIKEMVSQNKGDQNTLNSAKEMVRLGNVKLAQQRNHISALKFMGVKKARTDILQAMAK